MIASRTSACSIFIALVIASSLFALPHVIAEQKSTGELSGQVDWSKSGYFVPFHKAPDPDAKQQGRLEQKSDISILVALKLRNEEYLQAYLEGLSDPKSPYFRKFLSPSEFVERYSPSMQDYTELTRYFSDAKLNVITHENRLLLTISGSSRTFEDLLGVNFQLYGNGEQIFFSATNPRLPARFSSLVKGLSGLDNSTAPQPAHVAVPYAPQGAPPFDPKQVQSAYGIKALHDRGITGRGQNVTVIVAFGSPTLSDDLNTFANAYSIPRAKGTLFFPLGQPRTQNAGWAGETNLDVMWTSVVVPDATINIVVAPSNLNTNLFGAVNFAVSRNLGKIISLSWGGNEGTEDLLYEPIFRQAVAQGIAVFVASGDCGAFGLMKDRPGCSKTERIVSYPASSPFVTAVGATSLILDAQDRYVRENGWNGSGGGISTLFPMPSWQQRGGVPAGNRGVPDIAMVGDPRTGVWTYVNGRWRVFGGTSLSAPLMAGSYALVNQLKGANLGFASPILYDHARSPVYSAVMRDVTAGSNGFYLSTSGWDYVTGWGSPTVNMLATSFADRLRQLSVTANVPLGVVATITVNGDLYRIPTTVWLDSNATHIFAANQTVPAGTGTRNVFAGWSGLLAGLTPSQTAKVTQDSALVLNYKRQHLLTIAGGSAPSANWVDANSEVQARSNHVWNEEPNKSRMNLVAWQLDNRTPQNIARQISGAFLTTTLVMDGPHTVTFRAVNQFFVDASNPVGEISGRGWFDSGSVTTLSVRPTEFNFGNRTRAVFRQWTGSAISSSATITLTVDSPKQVSADFAKQYQYTLRSSYGIKSDTTWQDAGTKLAISIEPIVDQANQTRRIFAGWTGDLQSPSPRVEVTFDGPKTIQAEWKSQYFVSVKSAYGNPVGAGWFDKGAKDTISIEPLIDHGNDTRRVFGGWTGLEAVEPRLVVEVIRPFSVESNWKTQYLLKVDSDFPQLASGAGWYDRGLVGKATVSKDLLEHGNSTRHIFVGWTGSGAKETAVNVEMDAPKTVRAGWKTQYLITVNTEFGEVRGAGWHNSGKTVSLSVPSSVGFLVQQVFDGWSGDLSSRNSTAQIVVDSPKFITAEWRTDYTELIVAIGVAVVGAIFGVFLARRRWS